jgi:hypothetical protein
MFETPPPKVVPTLLLLKRACFVFLGAYLLIGIISAYRAYYQIHSLAIASDATLQRGSAIQTTVVSYARTPVDVRLELIQGTHSEILAMQGVPGNDWGFWDPRSRKASQTAVLTEETLTRFTPGTAQLRATAIGRPQWTRLPPPVVRELTVKIQHN